jgi:hypothetical protein
MLGLIVAIRNFIIALLLSWIGISFSAPVEDTELDAKTPEDTISQAPEVFLPFG